MGYAGLATGKRTAEQQILDNGVFYLRQPAPTKAPADDERAHVPAAPGHRPVQQRVFHAPGQRHGVGFDLRAARPSAWAASRGIDLKGEVSAMLPSTSGKQLLQSTPSRRNGIQATRSRWASARASSNFTMLQDGQCHGHPSAQAGWIPATPQFAGVETPSASRPKQMSAKPCPPWRLTPSTGSGQANHVTT